MRRLLSNVILAGAFTVFASSAAFALELIMVEQKGCHYCEAWMDEIAPAYPNTPEGRHAPLMRRDINDPAPDGAKYARRVNFTPTFILWDDGAEIARIEGYPGEDFFWPILSQLLKDKTNFGDATH